MKNRTRYLALLIALLVLCTAAFGQSPSWPRGGDQTATASRAKPVGTPRP